MIHNKAPWVPPPAFQALGKTSALARTARGRQLLATQAEATRKCQERRDRVLKHEWAQQRLCAIFGYERASQWNGYMPPRADPLPDRGQQVAEPNTSPFRAALIQLLRDVKAYEDTGELPAYAKQSDEEEGE